MFAPGAPDAYWTVVGDDYVPALADGYLRELRSAVGAR